MKCQYLQTQRTICRLRAGVVQIPCRRCPDTARTPCVYRRYASQRVLLHLSVLLCAAAPLCCRAPSAD